MSMFGCKCVFMSLWALARLSERVCVCLSVSLELGSDHVYDVCVCVHFIGGYSFFCSETMFIC